MCGIIGCIGADPAPTLIEGLKRLEYRGYDSCGIAVLANGSPSVLRAVGAVENLERRLREQPISKNGVSCGIGHTRWATHGRASEINAHPHRDCTGRFLVVHNGIIENHQELRRQLAAHGHRFCTETDTEVLPHLIEHHFRGSLEEALCAALEEIEGMYAIVVLSADDKQKLVAVRHGPPLVIGKGRGEAFIASDAAALLAHTREMIFLEDDELAVVRPDSIRLTTRRGVSVERQPQTVPWSAEMVQKDGHAHFMSKEIFEQPRAVRATLQGRLDSHGTVTLENELPAAGGLAAVPRVYIVACGTSLHAARVGQFLLESLAGIPTEVDYASEFRYRNPHIERDSLVVGISQSGETADTLAALSEGRARGAALLSICNVVGSTAARQSDHVLSTRGGPEIGVASTKTFTTQLVALHLLALHLAKLRGALSAEQLRRRGQLLQRVPHQIEKVLEGDAGIQELVRRLPAFRNSLYLGRGVCYPIALEGALKLKEISYLHAEGYPAGEMKHGPIALIEEDMPVVFVAPRDQVYAKLLGNIEEVKGRGARVVAIATEGDAQICGTAAHTVFIPEADPLIAPILAVVPLQLLAYHIAVGRGCNVDKPRNLAKTVTVE